MRTFVDAPTGRLVVEHVRDGDPRTHITVIDRPTGQVVSLEQRIAEIPGDELIRVDAARGLRLSARRTIDPDTGYEAHDEVLTDVRTGRVVSRRTSAGLDAAPRVDLLDAHLEYLEARAREEVFWRDEYARWSFERRAEHWYDLIRRAMRSQEEYGLDELSIFTPESHAAWRALEPEIDRVLDAVFARLGRSPDVIASRVGRPPRVDR